MRIIWSSATVILLAACQPPVPYEPVGGVGFGNYSDYQRQQAAANAPDTAPGHLDFRFAHALDQGNHGAIIGAAGIAGQTMGR